MDGYVFLNEANFKDDYYLNGVAANLPKNFINDTEEVGIAYFCRLIPDETGKVAENPRVTMRLKK